MTLQTLTPWITLMGSDAAAGFARVRDMHHGESLILAVCGLLLLALSAMLRRRLLPGASLAPKPGVSSETAASIARRAS